MGSQNALDDTATEGLAEILPSATWDLPPSDLRGLLSLPNGFLAGFFDNIICFSEAFIPHAWPVSYRISVPAKIIGMGVTGNSVVVLTDVAPYLLFGDSPESMSAVRIETMQACISAESIVDAGDFIIYASPDGLMAVSEAGPKNITGDIFTRMQWQAYDPSTLRGFLYEDMYIGISDTKAFTITKDGQFSDIELGVEMTTLQGFRDDEADELYIMFEDATYVGETTTVAEYKPQIGTFNTGSDLTYTWTSKYFESTRPVSMAFAQALPAGPTLTVTRDALAITLGAANNDLHRLPAGLGRLWVISLSGTDAVRSVTLASDSESLKENNG
jgi:hypothetical protein